MIPLHDVIPSRRAPWMTLALIALSFVVLFSAGHGWVPTIATLIALWIFGDNVEDQLGRPKFFAIFVLGGGAALGLLWLLTAESLAWPLATTGATAAVMGAYLLLFPTSRVHMLVVVPFRFDLIEAPALLLASLWLFVQAVTTEPAWFLAMIGSAVVGAAAAILLRPARDQYWAPESSRRPLGRRTPAG